MSGTSKNTNALVLQCMDILQPVECLSLNITVDNVDGHETKTIIHYDGTINAKNYITNEIIEVPVIGDSVSEEFPMNETEEPIEREISFTYLG
jgi:hypothetical protein